MKERTQPDKNKAESLMHMAEITLQRLHETDCEKYPSNTLIDYYDTIHKLLEAIILREGIKMRGEGAHQELIDYVAKTYKIDENTRQFLQQMRDYRNRISYEGFMVPKNYIIINTERVRQIIDQLFKILKE